MSNKYDYIIIGGGPSGLTLAWYLSKYKYKVAVIDKNDSLGGCHRVHRINRLFTEHGPRIYVDNFIMFKNLLEDMGLNFDDLFIPYHFNMSNIGGGIMDNLSLSELWSLAKKFIDINSSYKKISMDDFMNKNNFSNKAKDYIDRLCRLTDGAGSDKFTLYAFLQLANQNMLHTIYQPKKPNDIGLFHYWEKALKKNGVDIFLNTDAMDMNSKKNKIKSLFLQNNNKIYRINGNNYIFAIPPYNISQFLNNSNNNQIKNSFGKLKEFSDWSLKTNYLEYIPVIFHFDKKIKLNDIWGFPSTSWRIGYIVLSDYMDFNDPRSKTVISTIITKNSKSDYTNKTPNQTKDKNELINEVFRQLKLSYPDLQNPTFSIVSQNYHDGEKWIPRDTAFMKTKYGYINSKSDKFSNLYNCGFQNGNSNYSFTSIEGAVQNSINLLYKLENKSQKKYPIKNTSTIIDILVKIIIFILIWTIYFLL